MFAIAEFQSGLDWISKAARAGHFEAQAVMIALYAAGLGPDEDKIEAAKWAHLYLTNPSRLNLGAPIAAVVSIEQIKEAMDNESWLIGKQRARDWVPLYDDTAASAGENTRQKIATFDCYIMGARKGSSHEAIYRHICAGYGNDRFEPSSG